MKPQLQMLIRRLSELPLWKLVSLSAGVTLVFFGLFYLYLSATLPKIISIADYRPLGVTQVVAFEGDEEVTLAEFFKERRYLVPYERIPKRVVQAFLAAEDDAFFEHDGIRPIAMIRAAFANLRAGGYVQGGSTITQQVAKTLFLTPERTLVRKLKDVMMAWRLEENLSKEQILYLYLNQIYLGQSAYGIQAAAQSFFRKDVTQLEVAEAALLAGLIRAPSKFSPHVNPTRAKERQLYVLRRMFENQFISEEEMRAAAVQPLRIYRKRNQKQPYGEYFVEHVRRYLVDTYGEKAVYEEGLKVVLPTSPSVLKASKEALRKGLEDYDRRHGYRGPIKKLTDEKDWDQFLLDKRTELILGRVPFEIFTPEGSISAFRAMAEAGIENEMELLMVGERVEALVSRVDDEEKKAYVMVGNLEAELPLDEMAWAYPEENEVRRRKPEKPSELLAPGDVVLVLVKAIDPKQGLILVSLDQYPDAQASLLAMEASTGYVLAVEGGYDFYNSEFNRAIQAARQPGSSYKPFIFGFGLERGYTPASVIVDAPIVLEYDTIGKWKPENYGERFYGDTPFRLALVMSRNIPTIKLVQDLGVKNLIEFSRRFGFTSEFQQDLSISLGSATSTMLEMVKTYAIFPRMGRKVEPIFWTKVMDRDGQTLEEHAPVPLPSANEVLAKVLPGAPFLRREIPKTEETDTAVPSENEGGGESETQPVYEPGFIPTYPPEEDPDQVYDPRLAYLMSHLLKEVVEFGTGRRARALGRPVAGKTGTTSDYKDAWFMGFTPDVVAGVWVGKDNSEPLGGGEAGASTALPIWVDFMKTAVAKYPERDFEIPPGVIFATIDSQTGKLADPGSPDARSEAFLEGTEPTEKVTVGTGTVIDSTSEFLKEDFE